MNFLQGLGGVGAGLVTANQLMRQSDNDKRRARLEDMQIKQAEMGLTDLQRKQDDSDAMRSESQRLMQIANGTDADTINARLNREAGMRDADMREVGVPTTGKPDARYGLAQVHRGLADTALARGNTELFEKHARFAKAMEDEGFNRAIQMADSGASMDDITNEVNKYGVTRFAHGQIKGYDRDKRVFSLIGPDGKDATVNVNALERNMMSLTDRAKMAHYEALANKDNRYANEVIPAQALNFERNALLHDEQAKNVGRLADARIRNYDMPDGEGDMPADVKTAEWMIKKGVARNEKEAWDKVRRMKVQSNEKVIPDGLGGFTIHNPETGEIASINNRGEKKVVRAANVAGSTRDPQSEYQAFKLAWDKNKGNKEAQARLEKQARSMGIIN